MRKKHVLVYLVEFLLIGGTFAVLLAIKFPFYTQIAVLLGILIVYIIVGLMHHKMHHDFHIRVVLEYILVSALLFALFVFLNISKL